jgi:hypothetical protein
MTAQAPKPKHTVALLLLCAVFASLGAAQVFARDPKSARSAGLAWVRPCSSWS